MSKRHHKKKALSVRAGELATKERCGQNGGVTIEVIDRDSSGKVYMKRQRARSECLLDDCLRRKAISEQEHEVAMKFRWAYLKHVFKVKVCDSNYNPYIYDGRKGDAEDNINAMFEAERLLHEAYGVLSDAQRTMVIAVCGHEEWIHDKDRKKTLHRGLERLIDLWIFGRKKFSKMHANNVRQ